MKAKVKNIDSLKITPAQLTQITTLSDRRHRQLAGEHSYLPAPIDGRYKLIPWVQGIILYYKQMAERRTNDLNTKKERQLDLQNEILKVAAQKAKGEVMDVREVEREWGDMVMLCRQKLLNLPSKFSPRVPFMKSPTEIETELQKEIDEALIELSKPKGTK